MLVGGYPFEDPDDPKNFKKTFQVIPPILSFLHLPSSILVITYFCSFQLILVFEKQGIFFDTFQMFLDIAADLPPI